MRGFILRTISIMAPVLLVGVALSSVTAHGRISISRSKTMAQLVNTPPREEQ